METDTEGQRLISSHYTNLEHTVAVDQKVARFDVSVQDASGVQILQTCGHNEKSQAAKSANRSL